MRLYRPPRTSKVISKQRSHSMAGRRSLNSSRHPVFTPFLRRFTGEPAREPQLLTREILFHTAATIDEALAVIKAGLTSPT